MWRVRDRRTFVELRRRGRRARSGSVAVTFAADDATGATCPPRVAFAVPRKVGTAVVRNRLRRQLRAHLGARRGAAALSPGAYLVALRPGAADHGREQLVNDLDSCLDRLGRV